MDGLTYGTVGSYARTISQARQIRPTPRTTQEAPREAEVEPEVHEKPKKPEELKKQKNYSPTRDWRQRVHYQAAKPKKSRWK